jgi:hypothetical protein
MSTILGSGRRCDQIFSRNSRGRAGKGWNVGFCIFATWLMRNEKVEREVLMGDEMGKGEEGVEIRKELPDKKQCVGEASTLSRECGLNLPLLVEVRAGIADTRRIRERGSKQPRSGRILQMYENTREYLE